MVYLNENEEKIIGKFLESENNYTCKRLHLRWKDNSQIIALYDTYIEDENDYEIEDDNYEEFWSFVFKKIEIVGKPPVEISKDDYFLVNYKNFPIEILFNDKKIY